ncbi:serine protease [Sedimentitalea sp. CY04]|uniref:Serine protease n=1 Tax=Parasedimentitalea denitrificans TaxID=2211118 RepID=A0ABX0W3K6_9RHOB|nr:trypsin-like peptidase domain-containing protein [Sedimentitalea sp. CY04]NIZ60082.1 serine protease [Sedimentitalea sp. CY04]
MNDMNLPQLSISQQILFSTKRIEPTINGVATGASGTGFFFSFVTEGRIAPSIVTNKHVIEGANGCFLFLHGTENGAPTSDVIKVLVDFGQCPVYAHPDPNVDLCAILIGPVLNDLNQNQKIYYSGIGFNNIPQDWTEFDALEEVLMVGCPRGIMDEESKLPIFRRGNTATPLFTDYNGKAEFMVDMACFPGSSGSPLFILNEGSYKTNNGITLGTRFYFIGILYSGPVIQNDGSIHFSQNPKLTVGTMMHLGNIIKAYELRKIEQLLPK